MAQVRILKWNGTSFAELDSTADDITVNSVTTPDLSLTPSAGPSHAEGNVYYDSTDKTLAVQVDGNSTLQVGQEQYTRVRNETGSTITNGQAVYINGTNNGRPLVSLAQANSALVYDFIGVATGDIANNTEGFVTRYGILRNIDTSGGGESWADGESLYVSATTPGALTNVPPQGFHTRVGYVITAHATTGILLVDPLVSSQEEGIIRVAKSGGDYTTIGAGLAAASSGDAVVVYPGDYAENVTIPDGVRLVGNPAGFSVRITGADTTGTRVTMGAGCTLRDFTVVGPSSGGNPMISTNNATGNNILFTVTLTGGGGTGAAIQKTGAGGLAVALVGYNGGTVGGAIFDLQAGTTRFVQGGANANFGTASEFIKVTGTATVVGQLFQIGPAMVLTDAIQVGGSSEVVLANLVVSDSNTTTTNGLHITADAVLVELSNVELKGSTLDFLVDGGLTGAGSVLTLNACVFRFERLSAPAGYLDNLELAIVTYMDRGVENDPAFRVGGELSVGVPSRPAESAFGEGDSTVNGLRVFTTDSGGASFIDETDDAKSRVGSTFNFFQDVGAGHICYIGSDTPLRKFFGVKVDLTTAMVVGGGAVLWEYWNGSAWTTIPIMASNSNPPYEGRAQLALQNVGGEQIRFDYNNVDVDWASTAVNGVTAYWIRARIQTSITSIPVAERVKLHTNRTEINEDGFVEYYGSGQPTLPLLLHQRLTDDVSGSSPSNATINFASGINLTLVDNRFTSSATDEFGWVRRVQFNQDTSRPIVFRATYRNTNTDTGNILFRFVYALLRVGDVWNGSQPSTTLTLLEAGTGVSNQSNTIEFTFSVPDAIAGDIIAFKFGRLGPDASDTYTGNVDIGLIEANGYARSN